MPASADTHGPRLLLDHETEAVPDPGGKNQECPQPHPQLLQHLSGSASPAATSTRQRAHRTFNCTVHLAIALFVCLLPASHPQSDALTAIQINRPIIGDQTTDGHERCAPLRLGTRMRQQLATLAAFAERPAFVQLRHVGCITAVTYHIQLVPKVS